MKVVFVKISSPQTYRVVRFALGKGTFKQVDAQKATGVSLGLVNRVTAWMVSRGFAAEERGGYRVIAPAGLMHTFSVFRRMEELEIGSFAVDADEKALRELFKEHGAVLCLTTALPYYDDYFREPAFHAYGGKELCDALRHMPSGTAQVFVYRDDLSSPDDIVVERGVKRTTKLRTLVDLLCSRRAYAAERLIQKMWGTA